MAVRGSLGFCAEINLIGEGSGDWGISALGVGAYCPRPYNIIVASIFFSIIPI